MRALQSVRLVPARTAARTAARLQSAATGDEGMATAEYAVATVAAAGFGGILWKVITSPEVLAIIKAVISQALEVSFGV